MRAKAIIIIWVLAAFAAAPCAAVDTWNDVMPGVRYLHRITSVPWDIHVVTIDLNNPHVRLRVGLKNDHDYPDAGETVRSICNRYNAVVGINTDYFAPAPDPNPIVGDHSHIPQCHTVTDGLVMLPPGHTGPIVPDRTCLSMPADSSYAIVGNVNIIAPWQHNVTGGGPKLLHNGLVYGQPGHIWSTEGLSGWDTRQPRTGAAVSQDYRTLILAVVDGRQSSSVGMTVVELATLLKEFGGYNGLGFDGGGSSTMVINGSTVNNPSDGVERRIADCLMVLDDLSQGSNPMLHYESGFERPKYVSRWLAGSDGWSGGGMVASGGHSGDRCASISGASAWRSISSSFLTGVQWIELWAKCASTSVNGAIYALAENDNDIAAAVAFDSSGNIRAMDGNGTGGGSWVTLSSYTPGTWYLIFIRLDYNINRYQVFVNGSLKASGLGFQSALANVGLKNIKLEESTNTAAFLVDDVYVGTVDPAFVRVSPDTAQVVVGGSIQFAGISGNGDLNWRVVDEKNTSGSSVPGTIAQINSQGLLTALSPGSCKVRVQDAGGRVDVSDTINVIPAQSMSAVKSLADGSLAAVSGLIVSGVYDGFIYAQTPDRESGIRIISTKTVPQGSVICATGVIGTLDGERVLYAGTLDVIP